MRYHIANLLRSQGRFREASDFDPAVLDRQGKVFGDYHPHTLRTAGSHAANHRTLVAFGEAPEFDKRTRGSLKERFGENHLRTLIAAFNLAFSHRLNGD